MIRFFRVVVALLGLLLGHAVIQAGKARRIEQARRYYLRTGNIDQTIKIYNVKKTDLL